MANIDIGFQVQDGKTFLIRGSNKKEIPRDTILEIYQLLVGQIAQNRDYSSVTSVRKLLRIIDLECEPDDSDDEAEEPAPAAKPAANTRTSRPAARTVRRTPAKTVAVKKEESDNDSDDSD